MRAPPLPYLHILLCNYYNGYEYLALAIDFIFFISFNSHPIPRGWYFCPHFRNEKKNKQFPSAQNYTTTKVTSSLELGLLTPQLGYNHSPILPRPPLGECFCIGTDRQYFELPGPYILCHNDLALPLYAKASSHRQYVHE